MRNPFRNVRANLRALATTIPNLRTNFRTVLEQFVAWVITWGICDLWSVEQDLSHFWQPLAIFLGVNVALGVASGAVTGAGEVRRRRRSNSAAGGQVSDSVDSDDGG